MVVLVDLDPWLNEARIEPSEDLRSLPLRDEERATHIRTYLKSTDHKLVSQTLIDNADLFAWTTSDMPEVSLDVITYHVLITSISTKLVRRILIIYQASNIKHLVDGATDHHILNFLDAYSRYN